MRGGLSVALPVGLSGGSFISEDCPPEYLVASNLYLSISPPSSLVPGIEPRASHRLGKHPITEQHLGTFFVVTSFSIRS